MNRVAVISQRWVTYSICNSPLRYYCNSVQGRPAVVLSYCRTDINNGRVETKLAPIQRQYTHCSPVTSGWLTQSCGWRCSCSVCTSATAHCRSARPAWPAGQPTGPYCVLIPHSPLPVQLETYSAFPICRQIIAAISVLKISATAESARLTRPRA